MRKEERIKIFLVDDDPVFLRSLKHFLQGSRNERADIRVFHNGEECIQNLHANPEIVVLDYFLNSRYPYAMNGIQVLNRIKNCSPETEVVMLSSNEGIETAIETMKYGAYDYITKGKNAFTKVSNSIRNIGDAIELNNAVDRKTVRYKKMSMLFVMLIVTIYLINRFIP